MEDINMANLHRTTGYITLAMTLTVVLAAILFFNFPQAVYAAEHGFHRGEVLDNRYGHNHYYPGRGNYIDALPRSNRMFIHGGQRYFFDAGVWYRPYGRRFMIIAPPLGLILPFLPPYYATIWVGGVPYYYANDVYYVQNAGGYMVVAPPSSQVSETPPSAPTPPQAEQLFVYPRNNQNEKQQAEDRYQCHRWAVGQTNYDPTQPPDGIPSVQKNADYKRAMAACLDARGYTLK
jgi:hypothetical protein